MSRLEKKYKIRVHIGRRTGGMEQLQIVVWRSLECALGCKRMSLQFHGTKMCFMPDGDAKKVGNYSSSAPKVYSENPELIKYARSFEGEYFSVHKHENGFLYVDVSEVRPFQITLPSRSLATEQKADVIEDITPTHEEPEVTESTFEDEAVRCLEATILRLTAERDKLDSKIDAIRKSIGILKGEI